MLLLLLPALGVAVVDQGEDPVLLEGGDDPPEEVPVDPVGAVPVVGQVLLDAGDLEAVVPELGHRQLRQHRHLDGEGILLLEVGFFAREAALHMVERAVALLGQENLLQAERGN